MTKRDLLFTLGAVLIAAALSNFNVRWMAGVGGVAFVLCSLFG